MDTDFQHPVGHDMKELRRQAGVWLREQRQSLGLTQRAFAALVGVAPYTVIAQLEAGRISSKPCKRWAHALCMSPAECVRTIMRSTDPETYRLLFDASLAGETVIRLAFQKTKAREEAGLGQTSITKEVHVPQIN